MFLENGVKKLIRCSITHGEKRVDGKHNYSLDGYAEVNGKKIGIDYHGCRFHHCPFNCPTVRDPTAKPLSYDIEREAYIRSKLDVYIVQYGCEFKKLKYKPVGNMYKFQFRKHVDATEIIDSVKDGSFFGLVCVDIKSPDSVTKKFEDLGLPLIFQNLDLTEDHLSPTMKNLAEVNKVKFPRRQLCVTFNGENMLLDSELLRYYIELGMEVTNVYDAMEYIRGKPFKTFVDDLTKLRIDASYLSKRGKTIEGDMKQMMAKMLLNSSYGRMGMNLKKRERTVFCRNAKLQLHTNNVLFKRKSQLQGEYPMDLYEVYKIKRRQTDQVPVQIAMVILQRAKLHMLK